MRSERRKTNKTPTQSFSKEDKTKETLNYKLKTRVYHEEKNEGFIFLN